MSKNLSVSSILDDKIIIAVVEDGVLQELYNLPDGYTYLTIDMDADVFCGCPEADGEDRVAYGPNEHVDRQICLNCGGTIDDDWLYGEDKEDE